MNWKKEIQSQLSYAVKHNLVSFKYRQLVKDLLDGDSQFKMTFNNSNGTYDNIKLTGKITINTKRIILQKHNIYLLKHLMR